MTPGDRHYLQGVLDAFIDASIQRVAHSGVLSHRYRLCGMELRTGTGRTRLHDSVTSDVVGFFQISNANTSYDSTYETFNVVVDLEDCILNRSQAEFLSAAMTTFRATL